MQTATPAELRETALELAPRLRRYAHSLLGDAEAARDVVQDVLVRVHDDSRHLNDAGRPAAYLFAAVRNRCTDVIRKESRMRPLADGSAIRLAGTEADPAEATATTDAAAAALAAIDTLPPAMREAVRLKFSGGLSYAEIAEATGKTANNVGVLVHQGLKRLRETLAAQGVDHA